MPAACVEGPRECKGGPRRGTMSGQRLAAGSVVAWCVVSMGLRWAPGVDVPGYLQAFVCGVLAPLLLAAPLMALSPLAVSTAVTR